MLVSVEEEGLSSCKLDLRQSSIFWATTDIRLDWHRLHGHTLWVWIFSWMVIKCNRIFSIVVSVAQRSRKFLILRACRKPDSMHHHCFLVALLIVSLTLLVQFTKYRYHHPARDENYSERDYLTGIVAHTLVKQVPTSPTRHNPRTPPSALNITS